MNSNAGPEIFKQDIDVSEPALLYALEAGALEKLRTLYVESGSDIDNGRFLEYLDDLAFAVISETHSDEVRRNIRLVHSGNPKEQQESKASQLALLEEAKLAIVAQAGMPREAALSAHEKAKKAIATILSTIPEETSALACLGILKLDNNGEEYFAFPARLMPPDVVLKYDTYISRVQRHIEISNGLKMGTTSQQDLVEADRQRRAAHNDVSLALQQILQLRHDNGESWSQAEVRRLVAKMRDARFPNQDTDEKRRTEDALRYFHDSRIGRELLELTGHRVQSYGTVFEAPSDIPHRP